MKSPTHPERKEFECTYIGGPENNSERGCILLRPELEQALLSSTRNDPLIGRSVRKDFAGVTHHGKIYCVRESGTSTQEKWWTVSKGYALYYSWGRYHMVVVIAFLYYATTGGLR